jgi:protein phosphatase
MSVLRSFGETNAGRKRRRNEDAFVCEPPIFAVADGMGGAQAGEVASSLAATALSGALADHSQIPADDAEATVRALILEANRRVHQRRERRCGSDGNDDDRRASSGDVVAIGHVGDFAPTCSATRSSSRSPTTTRSSPSSFGAASSRPRRPRHPQRSVITARSAPIPTSTSTASIQAQNGDVFLLCSDGLDDARRGHDRRDPPAANRTSRRRR